MRSAQVSLCAFCGVVSVCVVAMPAYSSSNDQDKWERLRANPMCQVSDLEGAFEVFFELTGNRSLDEIEHVIRNSGVSWKTAPKAQ